MNIEIDYNPSSDKRNHFFISIEIDCKTAISFDWTVKGHRVIKQVLIEKKAFPKNLKPTAEWKTIVLEDRKFVKIYSAKWIDLDQKDWVNGNVWETAWEKPITKELAKKLLYYSQLFSDNYQDLSNLSEKLKNFEKLISKEVAKLN